MSDQAKRPPLFAARRPDATCSFCGLSRDHARFMVCGASPTAVICNNCTFDAVTCLVEAVTRETRAAADDASRGDSA